MAKLNYERASQQVHMARAIDYSTRMDEAERLFVDRSDRDKFRASKTAPSKAADENGTKKRPAAKKLGKRAAKPSPPKSSVKPVRKKAKAAGPPPIQTKSQRAAARAGEITAEEASRMRKSSSKVGSRVIESSGKAEASKARSANLTTQVTKRPTQTPSPEVKMRIDRVFEDRKAGVGKSVPRTKPKRVDTGSRAERLAREAEDHGVSLDEMRIIRRRRADEERALKEEAISLGISVKALRKKQAASLSTERNR